MGPIASQSHGFKFFMEKFLKEGLAKEGLILSSPLEFRDYESAFHQLLTAQWNDFQVAGFLMALRMIPVTGTILGAGAKVMRELATGPSHTSWTGKGTFADNCGTGGDGSQSFNLSTAAAIVAASAGVKIAKHGNRSVTSLCGSADLLFAIGFPDTLEIDLAVSLLEETGLTFFFAPLFHPALKRLAPVRRGLGVPTIFNLLGPLANPLRPDCQLIGVSHSADLLPVAEAMVTLGMRRGLVVHSRDGLDELSPAAISDGYFVKEGILEPMTIDPADYKITATLEDLKGGDAQANKVLLETLLAGGHPGLAQAVSLNAGALLWMTGLKPSLGEGYARAEQVIRDGSAASFLKHWVQTAQKLAS